MAFTLPTQYQNIQGDTLAPASNFDPTQANNFLTNFNDAAVNYSTNVGNDQGQANNLIQAYQYLSDPNNQAQEDSLNGAGWSQYMLGQLQNDITEQTNVANYQTDTTALQNAQGQASNLSALIQQMQESPNNLNAGQWQQIAQALQAAGDPTISSAGLSLTSGNPANANYKNEIPVYDPNTTISSLISGWLQQGNPNQVLGALGAQLASSSVLQNAYNSSVSNAEAAQDTSGNAALQGFTLNSPNYTQQQQTLQNYYGVDAIGNPIAGDTTGQVQINQGQAGKDIYQQAYQQRQQLNQQANAVGANSSGQRQTGLGNITAQASANAAGIYQQDANAAQQAIDNYNQQLQTESQQQNALTNQTIGAGIGNLFDASTQQNINAYNQNIGANDQQNLTSNQNAIQSAKQNSSLWNNIGSSIGSGLGNTAGTLASNAPKI